AAPAAGRKRTVSKGGTHAGGFKRVVAARSAWTRAARRGRGARARGCDEAVVHGGGSAAVAQRAEALRTASASPRVHAARGRAPTEGRSPHRVRRAARRARRSRGRALLGRASVARLAVRGGV